MEVVESKTEDTSSACAVDSETKKFKADDLFNCSICYEPLLKAKILCCLHHFCQLCLERHYGLGMPRSKIKRFKVISCPHCRELTVMSRGIEGLPENSGLSKISWLLELINSRLNKTEVEVASDVKNEDLKHELMALKEDMCEQIMWIHERMLSLAKIECSNSVEPQSLPLGPKYKKARFAAIVKSDEYNPAVAKVKRLQDVLYVAHSSLKSFSLVSDEAFAKLSENDLQKILPMLIEISRNILTEQGERMKHCESVYSSLVPEGGDEVRSCPYQNLRVKLKWRIGRRGTCPGMFQWPVDVAFGNDRIFVADKNNRRVQIFDMSGQFLQALGDNDFAPKRIFVNGPSVHVSDELGLCVKMFKNGVPYGSWGDGKFIAPCGLTLDSQKDYIMSDAELGLVTVFNDRYEATTVFKTNSPADSSAPNPYFIASNADDQIIVSDSYNNCIKIFAKTGQLLLTFGKNLLNCPRGVCLDRSGNIFVVDSDHHKVRLFDGFGQFQRDILTSTDGLNYPMGIDVKDNLLVITQCGFYGGHEVKMYALEYDCEV